MATFTWIGGGSNGYTDAALWNPGTVPGAGDTIIIPAPGLDDFKKLLDYMVRAATENPPNAA